METVELCLPPLRSSSSGCSLFVGILGMLFVSMDRSPPPFFVFDALRSSDDCWLGLSKLKSISGPLPYAATEPPSLSHLSSLSSPPSPLPPPPPSLLAPALAPSLAPALASSSASTSDRNDNCLISVPEPGHDIWADSSATPNIPLPPVAPSPASSSSSSPSPSPSPSPPDSVPRSDTCSPTSGSPASVELLVWPNRTPLCVALASA
mmetsp:Transcript_2847/g.5776  ORF Transcript_2847/g.5776 Transcript_2847/m.5776 type:complete len:207 (+) Transcript_2847:164-784(+)